MSNQKCNGLLGWIFEHKFIKQAGGWLIEDNACFRCGKLRESAS